MHRLMQRLLEGEPSVTALFRTNPFGAAAPRYCRVRLHAMTPASLEHAARTGQRWRVRDAGVLLPARASNQSVYRHWVSPPELLHPDALYFRRVSPALRAMLAAYAAGSPHDQAVRCESDLRQEEVTLFWQRFVPSIARTRGDFEHIDEATTELHREFGVETVLRCERIAERYVFMLRQKLEPHMYGGVEPTLKPRWATNFHFMLHDLLLDGRERFEHYLTVPASAVARCQDVSPEQLLHFVAVVRNEVLRFHMRMLRISTRLTDAYEDDIPGLIEYRELLTRRPPPTETWVPECSRSDSGLWRCLNFGAEEALTGPEPTRSATTA
jgi:hypothetical protein